MIDPVQMGLAAIISDNEPQNAFTRVNQYDGGTREEIADVSPRFGGHDSSFAAARTMVSTMSKMTNATEARRSGRRSSLENGGDFKTRSVF
jgi:hypothetical protein